ncbi:ATP-binding protein [Luteococcus sp. H138]|uniref:sensor histidine kinase n=1 Tax=unclassified Luteococcus TaxID=2639923 RepID=UPI00313D5F05
MRGAVVQGLRATGLLCWLLVTATALLPTFSSSGERELRPGLAVLALSTLITLFGLIFDVRSRWLVRVTGLMLLAAAVMLAPHRHLFQPVNQWAPGYWALPWLAWALTSLRRRGYLLAVFVVAPALTLVDIGIQLTNDQPITRWALSPAVWIAPPLMAMALFGDGLLWLGNRTDDLALRRRAAQEQQELETLVREAHSESDRLMHDHVLHALHALGQGAGRVSPELMVSECETALSAISDAPEGGAMLNIGRLLSVDPAMQRAGAHLFGSSGIAPRHVALSITAAAHEALDNVARHAKATRCDVRLQHQDDRWQVRVIDDGVGFDPSKVRPDRVGLRRSIIERMHDVGGDASVSSALGRGTEITLTWPRTPEGAQRESLVNTAQEEVRQRMLRTAWPGLATGILMTAVMAPSQRNPLLATGTMLAVIGVGLFMARHLRRHQLNTAGGILLITAATVGWLVNLWLAPDALQSVDMLWMAWGCSALLHLVVLQLSTRVGSLVTAGWFAVQLTGLVWRYGWSADWEKLSPTVLTGSGQVMIVLFGLAAARRIADTHVSQQTLMDQARAATARLQLSSHQDRFWSQRATDEALPLLQDVAAGRACPNDPSVVERARRLTVGLREELLLGPDEPRLLAALNLAREAGWAVNSTLTKDDGRPLQHAARLVQALGAPTTPQQEVTLSARGDQVFAVALEPTPEQQQRWAETLTGPDLHVDNYPGFSRLTALASPPAP